MNDVYHAIARYVKQAGNWRPLIRYRTIAEQHFLLTWLQQKKTIQEPLSYEAISLKEKIAACTLCGTHLGKKHSFGSGKNGIMVILHAPRLISPEEKRMLKSEAIELMKKMLGSIGLAFEECFISNIIKCEADVHTQPSAMYKHCAHFLAEEIQTIKPHTIIVMGQILPLKNLIEQLKHIRWFNIEHPITILNNPELKKGAWNTLKEVKAHLECIRKE